jgi:hypothetical protein
MMATTVSSSIRVKGAVGALRLVPRHAHVDQARHVRHLVGDPPVERVGLLDLVGAVLHDLAPGLAHPGAAGVGDVGPAPALQLVHLGLRDRGGKGGVTPAGPALHGVQLHGGQAEQPEGQDAHRQHHLEQRETAARATSILIRRVPHHELQSSEPARQTCTRTLPSGESTTA